MYLFAELGEPLDVIDYHLSDMLGDLAKWITAANPILEYDGTPLNQAAIKVIYKFIARLKLTSDLVVEISMDLYFWSCLI